MSVGARGLVRLLLEETILFGSLLKWTLLASGVGVLVGLSTTFFLWALGWTTSQVGRIPGALWFLPPGRALGALFRAKPSTA